MIDAENQVKTLGEAIGFGNMMKLAEKIWREDLPTPGGEFSVGPCVANLVECPCLNPVECDYCCGSNRVVSKVAEIMKGNAHVR